ncbi:MAG TPA: hypothetical protein VIU85_00855, partial [Chthoniobacterales bacterium]
MSLVTFFDVTRLIPLDILPACFFSGAGDAISSCARISSAKATPTTSEIISVFILPRLPLLDPTVQSPTQHLNNASPARTSTISTSSSACQHFSFQLSAFPSSSLVTCHWSLLRITGVFDKICVADGCWMKHSGNATR